MLCSHLKIAPSCRRFPPQTRGEHLWCHTTRYASADSRGGCFHDRCTCQCCTTPHMVRNLIFFILLLSLKVLQPRDVGWTSDSPLGHPVTPANSFLQQHHVHLPTSPGVLEQRLAPRKPLRLQMQGCAMSSFKQSNLGRVYNYSSCFFLYYSGSKNLTSVMDVHPPPHYLSIMYFLSLHLLFEKTLSQVLSF